MIALSSVIVLVVGIVVAAAAMFISGHDLSALIVVIAVSTAIAVGAAVQMGEEMGRGRRGVGDLAELLAAGGTLDSVVVEGPDEMRQLAEQLRRCVPPPRGVAPSGAGAGDLSAGDHRLGLP